jgi:subtilase-type serine protease
LQSLEATELPHPNSPRRLLLLAAPLALLAGCGGGGEGEDGTVDLSRYLPAFAAPIPMVADVLSGGILIGQDVLDQATNLLRQPQYDLSRTTITWIRQSLDPRVPANATNHPLMSSGAAVAHAAGYTGKGELIAFTDDYFSAAHEVFAGKTAEVISNGQPLVDDGAGNLALNNHGIAVASVAAGRSATHIGTAPDANIMFGTWDEASMAQFGQRAFADNAIAWNNSWGYRGAGLSQAAFDSIFLVGSGVEYLATLDLYSSQNVVVFAVSNSSLRNATLMDGLPYLQNGLEAGWLLQTECRP